MTIQLDDNTKKYLTFGLSGAAIILIAVGIFVPTARDYVVQAAKVLLTAAGAAVN